MKKIFAYIDVEKRYRWKRIDIGKIVDGKPFIRTEPEFYWKEKIILPNGLIYKPDLTLHCSLFGNNKSSTIHLDSVLKKYGYGDKSKACPYPLPRVDNQKFNTGNMIVCRGNYHCRIKKIDSSEAIDYFEVIEISDNLYKLWLEFPTYRIKTITKNDMFDHHEYEKIDLEEKIRTARDGIKEATQK